MVFIVDGDADVRHQLETLVLTAGWLPQSVASAEEFLALPHATVPSCLLMEQYLPDLSGLDLQHRLQHRVEMPIIFMSLRADIRSTVQAMKAGAFEFLTKPLPERAVLRAIEGALECSHDALLRQARARALEQRYATLSGREREVMSLVVAGRPNKLIGADLGISEITVKAHRGKVMHKMNARSLAELVTLHASLQKLPRTVMA